MLSTSAMLRCGNEEILKLAPRNDICFALPSPLNRASWLWLVIGRNDLDVDALVVSVLDDELGVYFVVAQPPLQRSAFVGCDARVHVSRDDALLTRVEARVQEALDVEVLRDGSPRARAVQAQVQTLHDHDAVLGRDDVLVRRRVLQLVVKSGHLHCVCGRLDPPERLCQPPCIERPLRTTPVVG
eukprot:CAMPEP_0170194730 /NCGR_PEP_ID=MMETSP0040_2-20121228/59926_1 /TAXON_ID=641309 /ORGANISM="Lotharella oceanica, Strain CCMP622" /LENGTH=184 /DNA_ID=CAMNT_0010443705 /DNA_START=44 /DNA_END=598 /DNA_ORIENTATION=+